MSLRLNDECAPAKVFMMVKPQQTAFVADIAAAAAVQSTRARWLAAVCSTAALRAPKARRRHLIVVFSGLAGWALRAICPTWTLRLSSRASDPSPASSTPLLCWGVPLSGNSKKCKTGKLYCSAREDDPSRHPEASGGPWSARGTFCSFWPQDRGSKGLESAAKTVLAAIPLPEAYS